MNIGRCRESFGYCFAEIKYLIGVFIECRYSDVFTMVSNDFEIQQDINKSRGKL